MRNPLTVLVLTLATVATLAVALAAGAQSPAPAAKAPAAPNPALQKGLEEALDKVDKGDEKGAIRLLETLRKDPEVSPPVLSLLGALYLKTGRAQEALDVLKPLADALETDPAVLFNAGRAAFALGQNDLGLRYFARSVDLAPASPAARALGLLLARQGQPAAAYQVLRPWVDATPDDLEPRLAAALLAINLRRLAEAQDLLKGLALTNPRVRLLSGELTLRKGDAKAAVPLLRPLVDNPPPGFDTSGGMELDARRILAEAYLRTGQPAEAAKLLAGKGADPATAILLAEAQYQGGDLKAGLATLAPFAEKILKADKPRDPDLIIDLATTHAKLLTAAGRKPEAAADLAVAARLRALLAGAARAEGPASPTAPEKTAAQRGQNAIVALLEKGKGDEALAAAREQIKRAPQDLGPRAMEMRILLLLNRPEEALAAAQAMVTLAPQSPDAVYARGVCQMALKKTAEAEVDLRQALKLQPQYVPALNDLAVILMLRGDKAEARTLLERVLKANPNDKLAAENLSKLNAEGKAGG